MFDYRRMHPNPDMLIVLKNYDRYGIIKEISQE